MDKLAEALEANKRANAAIADIADECKGYVETIKTQTKLLEEVYKWLHDGDMSDWDKRTSLHQRLGKHLGKPPVTYGE